MSVLPEVRESYIKPDSDISVFDDKEYTDKLRISVRNGYNILVQT